MTSDDKSRGPINTDDSVIDTRIDTAINDNDEEHIVHMTRQAFKDSLEDIDQDTLAQLKQARHAAMAQLDQGQRSQLSRLLSFQHFFVQHKAQWMTAGAFACAAVFIVSLWIDRPLIGVSEPKGHTSLAQSDDTSGSIPQHQMDVPENAERELLAANDIWQDAAWQEDEQLLDDLEFMTWLAIEEEFSG